MRIAIAATVAMLLLIVSPLRATILNFEANLDGLQEVPPNGSPAFGSGIFTLDNVSGAFNVQAGSSYQDLLGNSTGVSLNDAAVGSNGPLLLALTLDTPGATSGTFSGSGTLTATQISDVVAGNGYVNIRSNVFPSGEIRGQLVAVPEPASLALAGLIMFPLLKRRRG